ncbi:MAG: esterase [Ideonella sp. MAG2]|nr:MAG: esterase [Ideonella sp. MAG2]
MAKLSSRWSGGLPTAAAMALASFGSFHVGGRAVPLADLPVRHCRFTNAGTATTIDTNGLHWVEAMYAQYFVPQQRLTTEPLLLWHGGALTGACWESTPDGREGWLPFFVRQGWITLCCDAVERGRAGFPPVPQVFQEPPLHQPMNWAFERHRIGTGPGSWHPEPSQCQPIAGTRFPVAAYAQLAMQSVARWTQSDDAILRGYLALLEEAGPSHVLAHSQACQFAFQAAEARPDLVRSLVLVEPSGVGSAEGSLALRHIPLLLVWGDGTLTHTRWQTLRQTVDNYLVPLRQAGGHIDLLDLPALGVQGNSHLMMMDDNSSDIAGRIHAWLQSQLSGPQQRS